MDKILSSLELDNRRSALAQEYRPDRHWITVCGDTCCRVYGSEAVWKALKEELDRRQALATLDFDVKVTGCHGFCQIGPLVVIRPEGILYAHVQVKDVPEIVNETILNGRIVERLLYENPQDEQHILHEEDVPFYKHQQSRILQQNRRLDPLQIDEYVALDGYKALQKALNMTPESVIREVKDAKLRGRGGAGFPTGVKWELCRRNVLTTGEGYLICNADEGDPGAYMDRSVLEGNPHLVIEGMIIGAYAIGVNHGYAYVRAEYPTAVAHLRKAIEQAEQAGLLGKNILGSGFDFELEVRLGAGAFVCGEETALMASIEGRTGDPRPRPPYPAEAGLWGKPTNINNVETWANVPTILLGGGQSYASVGTETSKGTKIFSLAGKVKNTGLVEVPMGISLREIIYDIGGGIAGGKQFKAAQLGGPSGGCIPAEHLDVKIDYESLKQLGAIMGSGGMVIADENTCMVDFARYFMSFTQNESCGKCIPCRIGTKAMLATLERICAGQGELGDVDYLLELGEEIKNSALCGLGQTAPNPVLSTLRYFRKEYDAHIIQRTCPAKVCKALITYQIDAERCTGCLACVKICPVGAMVGTSKETHEIYADKCIRCGMCLSVCQHQAIQVA